MTNTLDMLEKLNYAPPKVGKPILDSAALNNAFKTLMTGTLWKNYAKANPNEARTVIKYVNDRTAGNNPTPPVVKTPTGKGIIGMLAAFY